MNAKDKVKQAWSDFRWNIREACNGNGLNDIDREYFEDYMGRLWSDFWESNRKYGEVAEKMFFDRGRGFEGIVKPALSDYRRSQLHKRSGATLKAD